MANLLGFRLIFASYEKINDLCRIKPNEIDSSVTRKKDITENVEMELFQRSATFSIE